MAQGQVTPKVGEDVTDLMNGPKIGDDVSHLMGGTPDELTGVSFDKSTEQPKKKGFIESRLHQLSGEESGILNPDPNKNPLMAGSFLPKTTQDPGIIGAMRHGIYENVIRPMASPLGIFGAMLEPTRPTEPIGMPSPKLGGRLGEIGNRLLDQPDLPGIKPQLALPPSSIAGELGPATSMPFNWGAPEDIWKGGPSRPYGGMVEATGANNPALDMQIGNVVQQSIPRMEKGYFAPNRYLGTGNLPAETPTAGPKGFESTYPKMEGPIQDITPTPGINQAAQGEKIASEVARMAKDGELNFNKLDLREQLGLLPQAAQAVKSSISLPTALKDLTLRNLVMQAGNTFKTAMASIDLSFPFRQGKGLITQPEFWKNLPGMVREYGSESFYNSTMDAIKAHPAYPLWEGKLAFTGEKFTNQEEAFLGNWLEHIKTPGLSKTKLDPLQLYAANVRGSDRAYSGMATKVRFDVANKLLEKVVRLNPDMPLEEAAKKTAKFVNTVSGRGPLYAAEKYADDLNTFFFSPRFQSSRLTMLTNPMFYLGQPKGLRLEALRAVAGIAGTWAAELALLGAAGGKYITDPTNSDYGKAVFGNTRIDPGAGFQQPIVLFSRLAQGKYTTPDVQGRMGKSYDIGGKEFGAPKSPLSLFMTDDPRRRGFIESKLSPLGSMVDDMIKRKLPDGSDVKFSKEVVDRMKAMFVSDMYDLYQEDPSLFGETPLASGTKKGMIGALGLLGDSVSTYK